MSLKVQGRFERISAEQKQTLDELIYAKEKELTEIQNQYERQCNTLLRQINELKNKRHDELKNKRCDPIARNKFEFELKPYKQQKSQVRKTSKPIQNYNPYIKAKDVYNPSLFYHGYITKWNNEKGFGFIFINDQMFNAMNQQFLFIHARNVQDLNISFKLNLWKGDKVCFKIIRINGALEAINVRTRSCQRLTVSDMNSRSVHH